MKDDAGIKNFMVLCMILGGILLSAALVLLAYLLPALSLMGWE